MDVSPWFVWRTLPLAAQPRHTKQCEPDEGSVAPGRHTSWKGWAKQSQTALRLGLVWAAFVLNVISGFSPCLPTHSFSMQRLSVYGGSHVSLSPPWQAQKLLTKI